MEGNGMDVLELLLILNLIGMVTKSAASTLKIIFEIILKLADVQFIPRTIVEEIQKDY